MPTKKAPVSKSTDSIQQFPKYQKPIAPVIAPIPEHCYTCKYRSDLVCRRYPPGERSPAAYPTVRSDGWCGEYQARSSVPQIIDGV